jgi:hypothetical protein
MLAWDTSGFLIDARGRIAPIARSRAWLDLAATVLATLLHLWQDPGAGGVAHVPSEIRHVARPFAPARRRARA